MKILFIGGTGIISSACSKLAIERGMDVYLLNRSQSIRPAPAGAKILHGDIRDPRSAEAAFAGHSFDAVIDFVAFTPQHIQTDLDLFRGKTGQYRQEGCHAKNPHRFYSTGLKQDVPPDGKKARVGTVNAAVTESHLRIVDVPGLVQEDKPETKTWKPEGHEGIVSVPIAQVIPTNNHEEWKTALHGANFARGQAHDLQSTRIGIHDGERACLFNIDDLKRIREATLADRMNGTPAAGNPFGSDGCLASAIESGKASGHPTCNFATQIPQSRHFSGMAQGRVVR